MTIKSILEDERNIDEICTAKGECWWADENTRIVAYKEPGESAYVPWFAIVHNGEIVKRINSRYILQIHYKPRSEMRTPVSRWSYS